LTSMMIIAPITQSLWFCKKLALTIMQLRISFRLILKWLRTSYDFLL
jgi:hypothetical protein